VIRTGDNTVIGRIAGLVNLSGNSKTPLRRELDRFVEIIALIAISCGIIFIIIAAVTLDSMLSFEEFCRVLWSFWEFYGVFGSFSAFLGVFRNFSQFLGDHCRFYQIFADFCRFSQIFAALEFLGVFRRFLIHFLILPVDFLKDS
jgi:hypothetical protein